MIVLAICGSNYLAEFIKQSAPEILASVLTIPFQNALQQVRNNLQY